MDNIIDHQVSTKRFFRTFKVPIQLPDGGRSTVSGPSGSSGLVDRKGFRNRVDGGFSTFNSQEVSSGGFPTKPT